MKLLARALVVLLLAHALVACAAGPSRVMLGSRTPRPNVVVARHFPSTYTFEVTGVTEPQHCASEFVGVPTCVVGMHIALTTGVGWLVQQFFTAPNGAPPDLRITLHVVDIKERSAAVNGYGYAVALRYSMRWQFIIRDRSGAVVAQLATETEGNGTGSRMSELEPAWQSVLEAVADAVGAALNRFEPPGTSSGGEAPPPPTGATTTTL